MYTLSIQSSFEEVIRDVVDGKVESDEFWVNILDVEDLEDGVSKEEKVTVLKENDKLHFKNSNGVVFEQKEERKYTVGYGDISFELRSPVRKLSTEVKSM